MSDIEIRGFSLTQPWATLVAIGAKRVETRSFARPYRGWIAIQAAKAFPPDARDFAECARIQELLKPHGFVGSNSLPRMSIVAMARIVAMVPSERIACHATSGENVARNVYNVNQGTARITEQEEMLGNYEPKRFGWILEDVFPIKQVLACKGALDLWKIPPEVLIQLRGLLAERYPFGFQFEKKGMPS